MIHFSMVENVGGKAQIVTRESFEALIDRPQVAELCRRISEQGSLAAGCPDDILRDGLLRKVGELKRSLPAFCWHATFKDGKRNNFSATASGLVMIDIDHIENPEQTFKRIREQAITLGLVAAHITPSACGLRLVFVKLVNMVIEEAQRWLTEQLKLQSVDSCTKDLARLSFAVPRSHWLFIDFDILFGNKTFTHQSPTPNTPPTTPKPTTTPTQTPKPTTTTTTTQKPSTTTYEDTYKGIPYSAIVDCLESLYGGKPVHGNRNTQIFSMACMLRYICNDDPEWIAKILPTYGEAESKWRSSIHSACSRNQSQSIPALLLQAIEMAKLKTSQDENLSTKTAAAFDDNEPPKMPQRLPKLIRHLIKNVPYVCRESVANAVFPALATHLSNVTFRLIDGTQKEATFMCVTMARQSSGKASINKPIEYIMADIRERDNISRKREQEWKDSLGTKGANKEKPKRPEDLCVQYLVTDMTNAAFVQRLKDADGKYIYTNLEELEMLKQLQTNGMKDIGKIICLCYDNGMYGQERVGTQSVTALLPLRWNWNASSTVEKGLEFFRNRLIDGTLSRVNFCTIINDETKDFVYGDYDEQFASELKPFIANLNLCKGEVSCNKALDMARRLQKHCQELAHQTEDVIYQEFAYRAVTIAYMKAMVLYIANDMTWDKSIEDFCEWSLFYDLWCKNHFFGQEIKDARNDSKARNKRHGRVNMLESLPDVFSLADAQEMRKRAEKDVDGTKLMLKVWVFRGYITFNDEKQMYEKTPKYKKMN